MVRHLLVDSARTARRIVVAVVGTTVLLIGVALLVLPGPAMVVIPIGLAILSLEFAWARRWLRGLRDGADAVWHGHTGSWSDLWRRLAGRRSDPPDGGPGGARLR